jgi:hypothetical protein
MGVTSRFDYVDRSGNYIDTRQLNVRQGGRIASPGSINKNSPTEQQRESKFQASVLIGNQ